MARDSHTTRRTKTGVVVTAKNGLQVRLQESGFAKIEGTPDQPYRSASQAIGHVAEMFHIASGELSKKRTSAG